MDGKKVELTDEEIVKALECCINSEGCDCGNCPYNNNDDCQHRSGEDLLDLIHRSQDENKNLKQRVSILEADNDDYKNKIAENELVSIDWHYSQVEDLEEEKMRLGHSLSETQYALSVCQDVNAEQKAEIERLSFYKTVFDKGLAVSLVNMQETINKQKAEIERLTKWKDKLQDTKDELEQQLIDTGFKEYCEENKRLTDENAELQKQVDELKGKICELVADKCNLVVKEQQAVKDTAKEIFTDIDNVFSLYYPHGQIPYSVFQDVIKQLAKKKGVEVE